MKKTLFGFLGGITVMTLISMASGVFELKNSTAEVEILEGIYIFTDSKPLREFEYLGTISGSANGLSGSQYSEIRDGLIKKCKKEFPDADGLVLKLRTGSKDKADAIKFKTE